MARPRAAPQARGALDLAGPQRPGDGLDEEGLGWDEEPVPRPFQPAGDRGAGTAAQWAGHARVECGGGAAPTVGQGGQRRPHPRRGRSTPGRLLRRAGGHHPPLVLRFHRPAQGAGETPEVGGRAEHHEVDFVDGGGVVDRPAPHVGVRADRADAGRDGLRDRARVPEETLEEDQHSHGPHLLNGSSAVSTVSRGRTEQQGRPSHRRGTNVGTSVLAGRLATPRPWRASGLRRLLHPHAPRLPCSSSPRRGGSAPSGSCSVCCSRPWAWRGCSTRSGCRFRGHSLPPPVSW